MEEVVAQIFYCSLIEDYPIEPDFVHVHPSALRLKLDMVEAGIPDFEGELHVQAAGRGGLQVEVGQEGNHRIIMRQV